MNLDEAQRKKVAAWVDEGLKLSEIQNRLASELGVTMTYMDVRFLVDDLKLMPKDPERAKAAESALATAQAPANAAAPDGQPAVPDAAPPAPPSPTGKVSVTVDQLARPGAVVSGKVTFSDGQKADWYLDQNGRLGLATQQTGYRPLPGDVQQFQAALEAELSRMGI